MTRPSTSVAIFTMGNNLEVKGDMTRRILICKLDARSILNTEPSTVIRRDHAPGLQQQRRWLGEEPPTAAATEEDPRETLRTTKDEAEARE
jgi:hypothetical protein